MAPFLMFVQHMKSIHKIISSNVSSSYENIASNKNIVSQKFIKNTTASAHTQQFVKNYSCNEMT